MVRDPCPVHPSRGPQRLYPETLYQTTPLGKDPSRPPPRTGPLPSDPSGVVEIVLEPLQMHANVK